MIMNAQAKNEDMKDVTRKLAHITSTPKAQLATKHADTVLRGYSHTIRYLVDIDIESPAEKLQGVKEVFREAAQLVLDGESRTNLLANQRQVSTPR